MEFSEELQISTVRQLTEKISREHYSQARRHFGTVNKNEIVKTIEQVFIEDWGIDKADLTRQALEFVFMGTMNKQIQIPIQAVGVLFLQ